jgi:2-keto-3-deoxy-L-rhamnonate aldolase RhmA
LSISQWFAMSLIENQLKRKLAAGGVALGMWITLESPSLTEIAVDLGFDWIVIDAEHGHLDFKEILEHLRAANRSSTTVLVRIQEIEQGLIKRVLDLGAQGIVVPQVTSAADVELAVRFAKYPPWGIRGVGGERSTRWSQSLVSATRQANEETLVIPIVETVAAAAAIDDILDVKGIDALFFGPADLSASSGYVGQWEGPGVAAEILRLKDKIVERGIACGLMATDVRNSLLRREQGFRLIGVGSDTGLVIRAAREGLLALGRQPQM